MVSCFQGLNILWYLGNKIPICSALCLRYSCCLISSKTQVCVFGEISVSFACQLFFLFFFWSFLFPVLLLLHLSSCSLALTIFFGSRRICHCEGDEESPLITPCHCTGSLRFVHQSCLQQWIKSSDTRCCELCKYEFIMETKLKPLRKVTHSLCQVYLSEVALEADWCSRSSVDKFRQRLQLCRRESQLRSHHSCVMKLKMPKAVSSQSHSQHNHDTELKPLS